MLLILEDRFNKNPDSEKAHLEILATITSTTENEISPKEVIELLKCRIFYKPVPKTLSDFLKELSRTRDPEINKILTQHTNLLGNHQVDILRHEFQTQLDYSSPKNMIESMIKHVAPLRYDQIAIG